MHPGSSCRMRCWSGGLGSHLASAVGKKTLPRVTNVPLVEYDPEELVDSAFFGYLG